MTNWLDRPGDNRPPLTIAAIDAVLEEELGPPPGRSWLVRVPENPADDTAEDDLNRRCMRLL
jgi:hypothetical protein